MHLRLFSPSGAESLHRLTALGDGFDRWSVLVAPLEQGTWTFRFEGFADDFATWEHAADLKIAAGVDVPLMREMGALLFDRARDERSRPNAERSALEAAAATCVTPRWAPRARSRWSATPRSPRSSRSARCSRS